MYLFVSSAFFLIMAVELMGSTLTYEQRQAFAREQERNQSEREEQQRKEKQKRDRKLYSEAMERIVDRFRKSPSLTERGCWVEKDCSDKYTKLFEDEIRSLREDYGSIGSVTSLIEDRRRSIKDAIRSSRISYATYTLAVLSDRAKERLHNGDLLDLPSEEKIAKILPSVLTPVDLEVLLYRVAETIEKSQRAEGLSATRDFFDKMERFIRILPQGYSKAPLLDKLGHLKEIISKHEYSGEMMGVLWNGLPEETRPTLPDTPHFLMFQELQREREAIDKTKKTYSDAPFRNDIVEKKKTEALYGLYEYVHTINDKDHHCGTRASCTKYIISLTENYLNRRLHEHHPLRTGMRDFIKGMNDFVKFKESPKFEFMTYQMGLSDHYKTEYKDKKTRFDLTISDADFKEAILKKRLNSGHIRMMMTQIAHSVEEYLAENQVPYEEGVQLYKKEEKKLIDRLEKVYISINKKAGKDMLALRDLIDEVAREASKQSPKKSILQYIYESIPDDETTMSFDPHKGRFIENKRHALSSYKKDPSIPSSELGEHEREDREKLPDSSVDTKKRHPLPHEDESHQAFQKEMHASGPKNYDVTVFTGKDEEEEKRKKEKEQKKDKEKKDPTRDIAKNLAGKAENLLGGFLDKALGGLLGGGLK